MKDYNFESDLYFKGLNAQDFLSYGVQHLAYIRPVVENGKSMYGIFSADGKPLVFLDSQSAALTTILQNSLEPVAVH